MDLLLVLPIMLRHTFNVMRNQNVYYDRYVSQRWLAIDTYIATLQHVACDRDRDVIM